METIPHQQTTKSWRLLGITGLALSVAFFVNEGQARTLPMPSPIQSIKVQHTHPTNMASTVHPLESTRGSQSTKPAHNPEIWARERDTEDKPQKKKFGLAILILGTLAEKS